jgi:hypothetical protein
LRKAKREAALIPVPSATIHDQPSVSRTLSRTGKADSASLKLKKLKKRTKKDEIDDIFGF